MTEHILVKIMLIQKKILILILTFGLFSTCFSIADNAFAAPMYSPGETLNPSCLPTDVDCTVAAVSILLSDDNVWTGNNQFNNATTFNGMVGIGTTTPIAKLSVTGSGTWTGKAFVVTNSVNTEKFVVLDNGNIGVDVANPTNRFEVSNGSNGYLRFGTDSSLNLYSGVMGGVMRFTAEGNLGIGTTSPGSRLDVYNGNISLGGITPPYKPTVNINPVAGNLSGDMYYRVTFVTSLGETALGTYSDIISPSNQQVSLSNIPVGPAGSGVIARKIWRTKAVSPDPINDLYYLVTTINDNTTSTYNDNIANSSLTQDGHYLEASLGTSGSIYAGSSRIFRDYGLVLAIGRGAGTSQTLGYDNVFIGTNSGYNNTVGVYNTFVGNQSGVNNVSGNANTFLGTKSGNLSTTINNTFIGSQSGRYTTDGANNTFLGSLSGVTSVVGNANTTGSNNTFLGYASGAASSTQLVGATAIGYNALVGCSDCLVLGDANVKVGIGSTSPVARLSITGSGLTTGKAFEITNSSNASKFTVLDNGSVTLANSISIGTTGSYQQGGFIILNASTTGSNISVGQSAGNALASGGATGKNNTAIGYSSLFSSASINGNTAIGSQSSYYTTGSNNTAVGTLSLVANTSGSSNVSMGYFSIGSNTTASNNTAVGFISGYSITTPDRRSVIDTNMTFLGSSASRDSSVASTTPLTNGIAIGYDTRVLASNQAVLGNDSITTTLLKGNVGIGTTSPIAKLSITQSSNTNTGGIFLQSTVGSTTAIYLDSSGNLIFNINGLNPSLTTAGNWNSVSDITYKKDIVDLGTKYGLSDLLKTTPRFYKMKNSDLPQIGFIAQELGSVIPEVVSGDEGSKGITYGNLVALAFQAIKELSAKVDSLALFVSNNITNVKDLVIDKLKVGSAEKPSGITLYDEVTKTPYCVKMVNGSLQTIIGECVVASANIIQNNLQQSTTTSDNIINNTNTDNIIATTTDIITTTTITTATTTETTTITIDTATTTEMGIISTSTQETINPVIDLTTDQSEPVPDIIEPIESVEPTITPTDVVDTIEATTSE